VTLVSSFRLVSVWVSAVAVRLVLAGKGRGDGRRREGGGSSDGGEETDEKTGSAHGEEAPDREDEQLPI